MSDDGIPRRPDASVLAPTRHLEVETKLDAAAGFTMPNLVADPALRGLTVHPAGQTLLEAVYYDTEHLDLLGSRVTLRRRAGGSDAGWHLKLPAGNGARTEVRLPLDAGADRVPSELASLVVGAARGRDLAPVASIITRRTVLELLDAGGTPLLELADDDVTGTRLSPSRAGELRWREIEVELLDALAEQAAAAGRAVVQAMVTAGACRSPDASKLGRLLAGGSRAVTGPPATGNPASALLSEYLARQRNLLIDADVRLRQPEPDDEAPHDARGAARRIRSVLRVYRPLFRPDTISELTDRLREIGTAVSPLRDLDVAGARLSERAPDVPVVMALAGRLANRRSRLLAGLRERWNRPEHIATLRAVDRLVDGPELTAAAGMPADDVLAPLLAAGWLTLRADAETALAESADAEQIHRVRKDAKTVRYAAEAAAGAAGSFGTAMATFATRLEQVQDILGAHQDAVAATALLDELAGEPDITRPEQDQLARWAAAEADRRDRTLVEFAELWPGLPLLPTS